MSKLYFTVEELNPKNYTLAQEQLDNLTVLIERASKLREAYGKSLKVTSGVRSMTDQFRINPKAPKSNHLRGAAMDVLDSGELKDFINNNIQLVEEIGLWFEDFASTPTWVHMQIFPPKSGKRFFIP